MRPATSVDTVRRRRAKVAVLVLATLTAVALALAAAGSAQRLSVLDYQAYVGGKGKAKPNLAPVTIGYINGQGGPAELQLPAGNERDPRRSEDGERRARRHQGTSAQAQRVLLDAGRGGRRPLRPADGQREGEGDHLRVRDRRQPVDLRDGKGTIPIVGVVTANPADPTAKNAFFLNGSQTSVLGALRHVYEDAPPEREDGGHRLSEPTPAPITAAQRSREGPAAGGRQTDAHRVASRSRPTCIGPADPGAAPPT